MDGPAGPYPSSRRLRGSARGEIREQRRVHLARARLRRRAIAAVVDHVVGELDLLGERHLDGDAALAVGGVGVERVLARPLCARVGYVDAVQAPGLVAQVRGPHRAYT